MVGRLLWKELREGWLVLLIAALGSLSVVWLYSSYGVAAASTIGMACSPAALLLWASTKGGRLWDEGKLPLAHVPLNRVLLWSVAIGTPTVFAALIGALHGWLAATYHFLGRMPANAGSAAGSMAMLFATAFVLVYLVAAAASSWIGRLVGLFSVIYISVWTNQVREGIRVDLTRVDLTDPFFHRLALIVASSLALFLVFQYLKRVKLARALSMVLLVGWLFGPPVYHYARYGLQGETPSYWDTVYSADRSLVMSQISEERAAPVISLTNRNEGWSVTRTFRAVARPVAFDNSGRACIVEQTPKSSLVRLIAMTRTSARVVARIPVTGFAIRWRQSEPGGDPDIPGLRAVSSISPDGRYMLLGLGAWGSSVQYGTDLWIVNLRTGESWIAVINVRGTPGNAAWLNGRLMVPVDNEICAVDLLTKQARAIPVEDGGPR